MSAVDVLAHLAAADVDSIACGVAAIAPAAVDLLVHRAATVDDDRVVVGIGIGAAPGTIRAVTEDVAAAIRPVGNIDGLPGKGGRQEREQESEGQDKAAQGAK